MFLGCTMRDGTAQAGRSLQHEAKLRAKRRASPEVRAIAKTFGVSIPEAKRILAAARKQL